MNAEPGKPQLGGQLDWRNLLTELEHRRVVRYRANLVAHEFVDIHAAIEREPAVKELHFEHCVVVPQRARPTKTDVPVLVITQLRQHVGKL